MIMFSSNIEIVSNWNDTEGRVILTEIKIDDDTFGLANVYAPNDDLTRTGFLKSLISDISTKLTSPKLILGGDWNLALEKIDRKPHVENTSNSRRQIQELIENFNLIDIWRTKNKSLERYTWSRNNPLSMSRIDFFLITSDLQRAYKSTSILESIHTDHKLVFLDLNVSVKPKRGPGFWKFNNSLLEDKNYTKLISETLIKKKLEYNDISDKRVLWDIRKYEIQTCTISYAKKKAKVRRELEQELLQSCDALYTKLCEYQLTESERVEYMQCKSILEDLNQYKELMAHIRSQVEQIEKDETK